MQLVKDEIDYQAYLAEPEAKHKVRAASSYTDELVERFLLPPEAKGTYLPWIKTHQTIRYRPNELSLHNGINGHGKSLVLGQIEIHQMAQGEKILIASMEMKPVTTMERMTRQATKRGNPSVTEIKEFACWTDGKLWIYDHLGAVKWQHLLAVCRYAINEYGITQIVIDSMMRCGIGDQDYDGQKEFVDALCTLKMDYPVHIHLVTHSRKRHDEHEPPGKFDLKGSGTITDLADNVFTYWRNKRKEEMREAGESFDDREADAILSCDKQRNGEWEGKIGLWYLPGPMQFVESPRQGPIDLIPNNGVVM